MNSRGRRLRRAMVVGLLAATPAPGDATTAVTTALAGKVRVPTCAVPLGESTSCAAVSVPDFGGATIGVPMAGTCPVPGYDDRCERSTQFWGGNHRFEFVRQTVQSPDGNTIFAAGYRSFFQTLKDANSDFYVAAFEVKKSVTDTSGQVTHSRPRWTQVLNGRMDSYDIARDIAISPDGETVYVTGQIVDYWNFNNSIPVDEEHPQGRPFTTFAFDAESGKQLWRADYWNGLTSVSDSIAIAATSDGSLVVVTGTSSNNARDTIGIATVAYSATTGEQVWVRRNDPAKGYGHALYDMVATPGGGVAIAGAAWKPGQSWYGVMTLAYAGDGVGGWSTIDDTRLSQGYVVVADESRIYIGGFAPHIGSLPIATSKTYAVARNLATGAVAWTDSYVSAFEGAHLLQAASLSPSGDRLALAGYGIDRAADVAALALGYDPVTGTRTWAATYAPPPDHISMWRDVAFSPGGDTVYAVGYAQQGLTGGGGATVYYASIGVGGMAITEGPSDMVTQALDADTGVARWVARYNYGGVDTQVGGAVNVHPASGVVTAIGNAWFGTQAYTPATGVTNPNGYTWFAYYTP